MAKILGSVLLLTLLSALSVHGHSLFRRWSEREDVEAPPPPNHLSLKMALRDAGDLTYSDYVKKLTVVKDMTMDACFIADLDPGLTLTSEEKNTLEAMEMATVVHTPKDLHVLLDKVGPILTSLCRHSKIFWLLLPPHPPLSPYPYPKLSGPVAPPPPPPPPPRFKKFLVPPSPPRAPPKLHAPPHPPVLKAPPSLHPPPPPFLKAPPHP